MAFEVYQEADYRVTCDICGDPTHYKRPKPPQWGEVYVEARTDTDTDRKVWADVCTECLNAIRVAIGKRLNVNR